MLDDISLCMASIGLYYIYISFLWSRKEVTSLIQDLQDYEKFGKPHDTDKINKQFNLYSKLYYSYCFVGIALYFIVVHTSGAKACIDRNVQYGRNEVCGFFSPFWLPFKYNFTPAYEIMMAVQLLSALYSAPVLTISFMVFVVVQHVCCKIRHLKCLLNETSLERNLAVQRKRLIEIINYHQYIIR